MQGDLEDRDSLARAVDGVYGVFSLQNYWGKDIGYDGEVRQGRNLAEAAAGAGVKHYVQASIASCDQAPTVRHFTSKYVVEKQIDALGLPRTLLRAVYFVDNFTDPKVGRLILPVLAGALKPGLKFHMVAVEDIGWFAAEAFSRPATVGVPPSRGHEVSSRSKPVPGHWPRVRAWSVRTGLGVPRRLTLVAL